MTQFTVIGKRRVFRVNAKSIQQLTRALREVGIAHQGIHEDGREVKRDRAPRRR